MRSKLKDAKDHLRKAVKKKKKVEEEINDVLGETEGERHKETLKETAELLREKIKKKNSKKVEQLTNKFMPNVNSLPIGLERYKDSVVFSKTKNECNRSSAASRRASSIWRIKTR